MLVHCLWLTVGAVDDYGAIRAAGAGASIGYYVRIRSR